MSMLDFLTREGIFRVSRLPALYSDFQSLRRSNPDGFKANLDTWHQALAVATLAGYAPSRSSTPSLLVLSVNADLGQALESKSFGSPLALGAIVQEGISNGNLVPFQTFLESKEKLSDNPSLSGPWRVVSWGLQKLGFTDTGSHAAKIPSGEFVVLSNVETAAKAFIKQTTDSASLFDRIYSKARFQMTFGSTLLPNKQLSEADLDALLKYLQREHEFIATDGNTIKIRKGSNDQVITAEDIAIASLGELISDLRRQTTLLSQQVTEFDSKSREEIKAKRRIGALAALRSKKLAESSLEKRYATLEQLEAVADKIQEASSNVQLVQVMESSTGVLRSLNRQLGSVERMEDMMDSLRQEIERTDEIGAVVGEGSLAVDESTIDDELAVLELEETRQNEAKREKLAAEEVKKLTQRLESLPCLPVVPSGSTAETSPSVRDREAEMEGGFKDPQLAS